MAAAYVCIKLHSTRYPDRASFQLPDPRQPACSTDLLTAVADILGRRQNRNLPPLHTAQAVHEVVAEENRTLDSVNCELATYSPADWVCLFEIRFFLSVDHLRQRFRQGTCSLFSLLARVPSRILQAWPCVLPVRRRPALQSTPSRTRCLVWVSFLLSGGFSSLARCASLDACPLALPAHFVSGLFSGRVKLGASFWPCFSHLSLKPVDCPAKKR